MKQQKTNNWQIKKLGEVCKYNKGRKPKKLVSEKQDNIAIPYINIKAFEKGIFDEYTDGEKCNLCEDGDLLMVWDGARAGFSGKAKKGAVGSTLMKIEPLEDVVEKNFIYYFLQSIYKKLNTNPRGVGIPHVEPTLLWEAELIVPPLETQHAIVSKIEELFSELDKGIAELKTAQQQLKTYRQSVLKSAFEGKLTNENVKNGELPDGWEVTELKNVCEVKRGKSKHRPRNAPELYGGNYPFIQTGDIRNANGSYIKKYSQTYSELGLQQSKLWPKGTLCITIAANIGETAILDFDACFPDSVVGLLSRNGILFNKYLNYFFISFKQKLEELAPATAQKNINVDILERVNIPLAPLKEQHRIVQEIESRLSVADKMEQSIQESLQKAEALRQSILKKAFCGELV